MEELANKITYYRKEANLTQKDLGDRLNVSPQAVSKWENGQAEPDASTLIKLCEIFRISTDELLGITPPASEVAAATATAEAITAEADTPQPAVERVVEQKVISGYCERCNKPLSSDEAVVTHTRYGRGHSQRHIYCKDCNDKRIQENKLSAYNDFKRENKKSIIWGSVAGVGAAAIFAVLFIAIITLKPVWATALIAVGVGIGYFAFVMQVLWGNEIEEVFFFFMKSFRLPGVIFTLDLDGILFLIGFKVIGAILTGLLSAIIFIFGLFITPIIALIVLPFASIKRAIEGKRLKKNAENA